MRAAAVALAGVLAAAPALGAASGAKVLEHKGRWESGYGARLYNVVGRLKNTSGRTLRWVKLRVDAVDERGRVVASTETYNESAEALAVPDVKAEDLLASGTVKPLPPGAEERFRASCLDDETPAFTSHRVTVVATPAAEK